MKRLAHYTSTTNAAQMIALIAANLYTNREKEPVICSFLLFSDR